MLIKNELSDNDLLFLLKFFNEFEITPIKGYLKYETLQQNKESVAMKNYNILNLFKKQNLTENNETKNDKKSVSFDLVWGGWKQPYKDSKIFNDGVKELKKKK